MTAPLAASLPSSEHRLARRVLARVVDDILIVSVGLAIAMVSAAVLVDDPGVLQLMSWSEEPPTRPPTSVAVLSVSLLAGATLVYFLASSALGGRTPGRALADLTVVRIDGTRPPTRLLFGRELLRLAMIGITIAITWPLHDAAIMILNEVEFAPDVDGLLHTFAAWLPIAAVGGLWLGAVLVDPLERAPHDRIAGTVVVRPSAWAKRGA